ncbi:MAG: PITH domain-containing protein [Piptocephalis tieghemiana]|nr:MAG: PITH domain-containing protein [Piptocephalis tieghemiana]
MSVENIESNQRYAQVITDASPTRLVVAYFTAKWCGPCKIISPVVDALAQKFTQVTFIKVDVDVLTDVAQASGVTAMPTFQFIKNSKKVDEMKGADGKLLLSKVEEHRKVDEGTSSPSASSSKAPSGQILVNKWITKDQISALNAQEGKSPLRQIVASQEEAEEGAFLQSDVDEQIILHFPFGQTIKLHSLSLSIPEDVHSPLRNYVSSSLPPSLSFFPILVGKISQGPKTIKLYANRLSLSFEEALDIEPTQTLHLKEKDLVDSLVIPLRFVKFQSVNDLVVFIEDNQNGEETSVLKRIEFYGSPVNTTDMSQLSAQSKQARNQDDLGDEKVSPQVKDGMNG